MEIKGQAALVTGAGSGIGADVARHLAKAGAKVAVLDVNKEAAETVAKEIGGILATAIGPVIAAGLTAATGSWWPIAVMLIVYSAITLISIRLAPETRGRDLVDLEDAL